MTSGSVLHVVPEIPATSKDIRATSLTSSAGSTSSSQTVLDKKQSRRRRTSDTLLATATAILKMLGVSTAAATVATGSSSELETVSTNKVRRRRYYCAIESAGKGVATHQWRVEVHVIGVCVVTGIRHRSISDYIVWLRATAVVRALGPGEGWRDECWWWVRVFGSNVHNNNNDRSTTARRR